MRKLKIKKILNMASDELLDSMTDEQHEKMKEISIKHAWNLLVRAAQESNSDLKDDDDYVTMDEYLEYLEEISSKYSYKMKEKIFEVKGTTYKLIEIEKNTIYELKRQAKNGIFYEISRYNSRSMEEALEYAKEYKIKRNGRTTKKEMKENYTTIIPITNRAMKYLLAFEKPISHCDSNDYGWICDNYEISDDVLVSTGYSPIDGIKVDYEKVKKYENLAKEFFSDKNLSFKQKEPLVKGLLKKLIKELI